jgi:hypothetical protein
VPVGARAVFTPDAVAGSGDHPAASHGARPVGTLFTLGANVNGAGGTRGNLSVPLPSGDTTIIFRTSGVSGTERVRVQVTAGDATVDTTVTVAVQWSGLVAMPREGATYYFTDQSPATGRRRHGNVNNWVDPSFGAAVEDVFRRYFAAQAPPRFTGGETRFAITDAALRWGGLLDVDDDVPWQEPHRLHRTGTDMDVRYWSMTAAQRRRLLFLCREVQLQCERHGSDGVYHFHLRP